MPGFPFGQLGNGMLGMPRRQGVARRGTISSFCTGVSVSTACNGCSLRLGATFTHLSFTCVALHFTGLHNIERLALAAAFIDASVAGSVCSHQTVFRTL